jgi:ParB-like chromosome segregation protein Spo0J
MNIAPSLQGNIVPTTDVHPHEGNPRKGDVEKIAESLKRFGQVRPILTTEDGTIIAGNHTFLAAKSLGWEQIAAVKIAMSDQDAKAYMLADNKTSDGATWDDENLVAILEELGAEGLEGTGFTLADLDDLTAALDSVIETEPEPFMGEYAEDPSVTAERWEGRSEGQKREVVFLLLHADFERFRENVQALKSKYATESMAVAIYEAVYREALGEPSPQDQSDAREEAMTS